MPIYGENKPWWMLLEWWDQGPAGQEGPETVAVVFVLCPAACSPRP